MGRVPTAETGSTHERTASPPKCTVQAPHCAMPHPNFVPVIPRLSRRTHRSGVFAAARSEEHTSELQALAYLVCRLLLEKKKSGPGGSEAGGGRTSGAFAGSTSRRK